MEALEQLQKQLGNVDELRSIVKTMKALSAASIRQYEQAVVALSGYYSTVERGLQVALRDLQTPPPAASPNRAAQQLAAIVFGSDHGLCGRFNEEISDHTLQWLANSGVNTDQRLVLAVGARVAAALEHAAQPVARTLFLPGSAAGITATVDEILLQVDHWHEQEDVHHVHLFYNCHAGGKHFHPVRFELLPVNLQRFRSLAQQRWPSRSLPTFSMDRAALLSRLLRQYLFVSIFRACAESQASEHASRLAAMQAAQRNLDERFEEVASRYRRARQNAITAELLDLVAGFEAITEARATKTVQPASVTAERAATGSR